MNVSIPLPEFEGLNGMGGHFAAAAPIGGFQNGTGGRKVMPRRTDKTDGWLDGRRARACRAGLAVVD